MTVAVMAFATSAMADVTYVAGMTGVTWGGCKRDVSSAFGSLKGFKSITIENGEEADTQLVTVSFEEGAVVTKEAAVASLGDKAGKYVVKTWEAKK